MNRPREASIDNLTLPDMQSKLKDINACIVSAKDDESRQRYQEQADYAGDRIAQVLNMSMKEHYPSDLGNDGEGGYKYPMFI